VLDLVGVRKECGRPNPANTDLRVLVHPDTPQSILELLEGERDWLAERGARLEIERGGGSARPPPLSTSP